MDKDFFKRQMVKIAEAFGVPAEGDKFNSRAKTYWDYLSSIDDALFSKIADMIITREERFPTIAKIYEYKNSFPATVTGPSSTCHACESTGLVHARKANGMEYVFRCPECQNWQGKYEAYPMWSIKFRTAGFMPTFSANEWDEGDELQVKGLLVLGIDSIAWQKAPEALRNKAEDLHASGWRPKTHSMR